MRNIIIISSAALIIAGCSHTQVPVQKLHDDKLSCTEIATEVAEINMILRDIDDKTGMSGRNVAMGVFFWPGIVVNQMNASDARKAAQERLVRLHSLSEAKECS